MMTPSSGMRDLLFRSLPVALAVALLVLSPGAPAMADAQPAAGSSDWRPVRLGANPVAADSLQRLRLAGDGGLVAYGGCNGYVGRYRRQGTAWRIVALSGSRRICAAETMHTETMFYAALKTARLVRRDGDLLRLCDDRAREIARFVAVGGE